MKTLLSPMSRWRAHSMGCLIAICLAAPSLGAWAEPANTPSLAGTWQYQPRNTHCAEQYFFRTDGTVMVSSQKEVTESTYELTPDALPGGFYRFETLVTQTNGQRDCQGKQTPVGQPSVLYLRFQANGERFVLCRNANLSACMGPWVRLKGRMGA